MLAVPARAAGAENTPMTVLSLPHVTRHFDPMALTDRLHIAHVVTRPLMQDIIDTACRRFPSLGQTERTVRLTRLIDAEAWADAALTLPELELPLWRVRRIAYDQGEWCCALSRERELPSGWTARSKRSMRISRLLSFPLSSRRKC